MSEIAEADARLSTAHAKRTMTGFKDMYRPWLFAALVLIAAILRIYLSRCSGLRPDELFSLSMATGHSLEHPAAVANPRLGDFVEPEHPIPAEEFRRYLQHDHPPESVGRVVRAVLLSDTSPPFYYLLLYGWTSIFGTGDLVLRLFSTVCAVACLPLLAFIARRIGGKPAVFAACVLFALSPLSIYYSADGRMYPLLWLCVLATMATSLALRERGGGAGLFAGWTLCSAAGFLTHYFFVFAWLPIVAYLFFRPAKLKPWHLAVCMLATALVILPWYIKVPQSLASWRITKDWLKERPSNFSRLWALRDIVTQFFYGHEKHLWIGRRPSNLPPFLLFGVLATLMLWRLRIRVLAQDCLLLGLVFGTVCAGPLVFDFLQHTYTVAWPRYAIAALPAAYLLAAAGLACLNVRTHTVLLSLIVLAWTANLFRMYRDPSHWTPIREISRTACSNGSASDLILVHSIPSGVIGVARYASGPAPMASWVGQLGTRHMPDSLQQLAAGRTRIVFVKLHEVGEPAPEEEWLRANAVVSEEHQFEMAEAVDFRPRNAETF